MAGKPFDATMKDLIEADAASWAALASSVPPLSVRFEDADVSSVTAAADKVLRVRDSTGEWLLDLEPQSSHAGDAPEALHLYSTLLQHRHNLPVRSVLLLLRPRRTRRRRRAYWSAGTRTRKIPISSSATAWYDYGRSLSSASCAAGWARCPWPL